MTSAGTQALIEEARSRAADVLGTAWTPGVFTRIADALEASEDARRELVTLVEEFAERLEREADERPTTSTEATWRIARQEHAATLRGFLPQRERSDG